VDVHDRQDEAEKLRRPKTNPEPFLFGVVEIYLFANVAAKKLSGKLNKNFIVKCQVIR
jgi:hypothetical protein